MLHDEIQNRTGMDVCLTASLEADTNSQLMKWSFVEPSGGVMWDFMAVTKALADENRVRLLLALRQQELCVCQLIELIKLAPSTVSKHMSILRSARLVDARKDGRWMYYRLAGAKGTVAFSPRDNQCSPQTISPIVREAIEWAWRSLADDPQIIDDGKRLSHILKMDVHKLCESQCPPKQNGCGKTISP
jgi:ArsR family transcriptional regulator, arsenate/arsenite/antimonite-responsive transcriptional repressor